MGNLKAFSQSRSPVEWHFQGCCQWRTSTDGKENKKNIFFKGCLEPQGQPFINSWLSIGWWTQSLHRKRLEITKHLFINGWKWSSRWLSIGWFSPNPYILEMLFNYAFFPCISKKKLLTFGTSTVKIPGFPGDPRSAGFTSKKASQKKEVTRILKKPQGISV